MSHSWAAAWVILGAILTGVIVASGENPAVIVGSVVITVGAIVIAVQLRKLDQPGGAAMHRRLWRIQWWASWPNRKLDRRIADQWADWWRVNDEDEEADL